MTSEPPDPGPVPDLAWLPVARLRVDHTYQRTLESRRSQTLIERIAAEFRWLAFQAILATPDGQEGDLGMWLVLDGQHRAEGARRAGITHVPAVVIPGLNKAEQAAAFVRANTDRVSVNAFALHHARLAAGAPGAMAIDRACLASAMSIPRYPIPADRIGLGQTLALGTIDRILKLYGEPTAILAMSLVGAAYARQAGALRAPMIAAVAYLVAAEHIANREGAGARIGAFLQRHAAESLMERARKRKLSRAGTERDALIYIIRLGMSAPSAPEGESFIKPLSREQMMRGKA